MSEMDRALNAWFAGLMNDSFYSLGYILATMHIWRDYRLAQRIIDGLADEDNQ